MIRRSVLASPTGANTWRLGATRIPIGLWPETPTPAIPTRWTVASRPKAPAQLPVDIFTTADEAVIRAALPGVDPEQIEISVHQNTVTIGAQLPAMSGSDTDRVTWLVSELGGGALQRTLRLPFDIQADQVEAQFANGMLQIVLPKPQTEKPHRISVQVRPELNYELEAGENEEGTFAAD